MIDKKIKKNTGESIIETLFYIVLFTLLSIVVINALITMMRSFKETTMNRELAQSSTAMEVMSREIKKAYDSSPIIIASDLLLNTKDNVGNNKIVEFELSGTNILYKEDNVLTGNLNSSNILVTGLSFTRINTTNGKAIKITMSVAPKSNAVNSENFYDTIVLRGSY